MVIIGGLVLLMSVKRPISKTFAISKIARKDILKARQLARHSSIDTTMIYVHEADRLDNPGEALIDYVNGNGGEF